MLSCGTQFVFMLLEISFYFLTANAYNILKTKRFY